MRFFVVFLFLAGGIFISTSRSSAQDYMPLPAPPGMDGSATPEVCPPCAEGHRTLCHGRLAGLMHGGSCSSDCNCACHGSYKYPVPSQYTYFWPGIYSQQMMTQYISPWRYPDLNPIPERWNNEPAGDLNPYSGYRY